MKPWTWGKTAIISKACAGTEENHSPGGLAAFLPTSAAYLLIQSRAEPLPAEVLAQPGRVGHPTVHVLLYNRRSISRLLAVKGFN